MITTYQKAWNVNATSKVNDNALNQWMNTVNETMEQPMQVIKVKYTPKIEEVIEVIEETVEEESEIEKLKNELVIIKAELKATKAELNLKNIRINNAIKEYRLISKKNKELKNDLQTIYESFNKLKVNSVPVVKNVDNLVIKRGKDEDDMVVQANHWLKELQIKGVKINKTKLESFNREVYYVINYERFNKKDRYKIEWFDKNGKIINRFQNIFEKC